jgi:hypothetical protein
LRGSAPSSSTRASKVNASRNGLSGQMWCKFDHVTVEISTHRNLQILPCGVLPSMFNWSVVGPSALTSRVSDFVFRVPCFVFLLF